MATPETVACSVIGDHPSCGPACGGCGGEGARAPEHMTSNPFIGRAEHMAEKRGLD